MENKPSFEDITGMTSEEFAVQEIERYLAQSLYELSQHLEYDLDELTAAYHRGLQH